jgi:two-component system LytT family response regulator
MERMPVTVFVTAFDQHAVRAFESAATDYVLNPYGDERMEAAFSRAKARLDDENVREFGQSMLKLLDGRPGQHISRSHRHTRAGQDQSDPRRLD